MGKQTVAPRIRRGRPPAPPGTARSQRVVTFVTDGELLRLQQWAESRGLPLSALVHELLAKQVAAEN